MAYIKRKKTTATALNESSSSTVSHKNTICCPKPTQNIKDFGKKWKVFLAGPIQGAPSWQHQLTDINNVLFLSPRRRSYKDFDYKEQTLWERTNMNYADVILFWIPEETEHIEGRSYAQTTRTEFGEYLAQGKKIIFGCYDDFPGKRYFQTKLDEYKTGVKIHSSLDDCIKELKTYIKECEKKPKIYFTSDTHFGDERALELSKRPFINTELMDKTLIRNWNNTVHPCDIVYHLGDFAKNPDEVSNYLNGKKILIYGNYERDKKYEVIKKFFDEVYRSPIIITVDKKKYYLSHEPLKAKRGLKRHPECYGAVFGHIHGRQKVKEFKGVDCGVDSNNYIPMSIDDVNFYINAIEKGYYDKEVWC